MKKEYSKPFLALESFQLDAAIAASCSSQGYLPLNHFIGSCSDNTLNGYAFDDNCDVDLTVPGTGDNIDDYACYHGPELTEGMTYIYS